MLLVLSWDCVFLMQEEREQKHAYKRELDQHKNSEALFNFSNLAFSTFKTGSTATDADNNVDLSFDEDFDMGTPLKR